MKVIFNTNVKVNVCVGWLDNDQGLKIDVIYKTERYSHSFENYIYYTTNLKPYLFLILMKDDEPDGSVTLLPENEKEATFLNEWNYFGQISYRDKETQTLIVISSQYLLCTKNILNESN